MSLPCFDTIIARNKETAEATSFSGKFNLLKLQLRTNFYEGHMLKFYFVFLRSLPMVHGSLTIGRRLVLHTLNGSHHLNCNMETITTCILYLSHHSLPIDFAMPLSFLCLTFTRLTNYFLISVMVMPVLTWIPCGQLTLF
jgi:hypothetical protein